MALEPIDLGPFRALVGFSGGGHVALLAIASRDTARINWRARFMTPLIYEEDHLVFGPVGYEALPPPSEYPVPPAFLRTVYAWAGAGYPFEADTAPWGMFSLVNLAQSAADHPDPERTEVVLELTCWNPAERSGVARPGFLRCEVYRGQPIDQLVDHVETASLGQWESDDALRADLRFRRDGLSGRTAAAEAEITINDDPQTIGIWLPVQGSDEPIFEVP